MHLIFAIIQFKISNLMNWIFSLFQTWILQATAGRKIQFKIEKKNPVHQTWYFKLENCKNQVQIDREKGYWYLIVKRCQTEAGLTFLLNLAFQLIWPFFWFCQILRLKLLKLYFKIRQKPWPFESIEYKFWFFC